MSNASILLIAGSSRTGAFSARLLAVAGRLAEAAGARTTHVDLRALSMPLYDGDLEQAQGVPAGARQLRDLFTTHDGAIIVTPEYNGFPTPLFINAFDWLSRVPAEAGKPQGLAAVADKPVGLLGSSPGPLGGLRALNQVRQYLGQTFGMLVVPQQFALSRAAAAFADDGELADAQQAQSVRRVVDGLLRVTDAMRAARAG